MIWALALLLACGESPIAPPERRGVDDARADAAAAASMADDLVGAWIVRWDPADVEPWKAVVDGGDVPPTHAAIARWYAAHADVPEAQRLASWAATPPEVTLDVTDAAWTTTVDGTPTTSTWSVPEDGANQAVVEVVTGGRAQRFRAIRVEDEIVVQRLDGQGQPLRMARR